jgi:hypothetical protein
MQCLEARSVTESVLLDTKMASSLHLTFHIIETHLKFKLQSLMSSVFITVYALLKSDEVSSKNLD